jgi:molybdopterin converting factor small subunit
MALLKVQFHGLWGLYLGFDQCQLESAGLDEAIAGVEDKFGPLLRHKLREHGVKLDGDIKKYSYITLNSTGLQQLKDNSIQDGDILHIFPAVTGG